MGKEWKMVWRIALDDCAVFCVASWKFKMQLFGKFSACNEDYDRCGKSFLVIAMTFMFANDVLQWYSIKIFSGITRLREMKISFLKLICSIHFFFFPPRLWRWKAFRTNAMYSRESSKEEKASIHWMYGMEYMIIWTWSYKACFLCMQTIHP